MTDPGGLPREQEAVRRLLADARHDAPPPAEVVARLDETLASLVAERGSEPLRDADALTTTPVTDLAARRRRAVGTGLLAAAAIVVAGVAVGQLVPGGGGDSESAASSATSSRDLSPTDPPQERSQADAGAAEAGPEAGPEAPMRSTAPLAVPTLSSADPDLDEDVLDLRTRATFQADRLDPSEALAGCELPRLERGRSVGAEVDGRPGAVVFAQPSGAAQDVAVYVCGREEPVRTLTLPAP
ncbi:hypothetical protein [Nocardioides sp. SYSU D00065]|uniref:hypothetical protein n=1 Tax=Nocardioides sp. SYSU D00065 TaxID=2817378 RepID=UPI001B320557|nr:hypothetical protein [Nocardioides sp. SYSU D00065]